MNYIKELRPASFRGISFLTPGDDVSTGRRIIAHQYPGRDEPFHEDLGADLKEFNITALITGDSFVSSAKAFAAALEQPGVAQLVHPHLGSVQVVVLNHRRIQNSGRVGVVEFSISLQKAGFSLFPTAASNTAGALLSESDFSFSNAISDFQNFFTSTGIPDFITSDSVDRNASFLNGLQSALSKTGVLRSFTSAWPVLDVLSSGFSSNVIDLYKTIRDLAAPSKKPIIGQARTSSPAKPVALLNSLMISADQSLIDQAEATTPNKGVRIKNAQSLDLLHRTSSLTAGVGSVRHAVFDSRDQAVFYREQLGNRLSKLRDDLGEAGWDASWRSMASLQDSLNRDINARLGRLPRTVKIVPASSRSSLALANRLYGDDVEALLDQAEDISKRNGVRHPGFVPVRPLEVLLDVQ